MNILNVELETARKIFWLLKHDYIFLGSYNDDIEDWDGGAYPAINCNDIFLPGADAESLKTEDLDAYLELAREHPRNLEYCWCAVKRSAKPWRFKFDKDDHALILKIQWTIAKHRLKNAWGFL